MHADRGSSEIDSCRAALRRWESEQGRERTLDVRWLMTASGPPQEYVRLTEADQQIVDCRPVPAGERSAVAPLILMPQLVNCHTHLEFSGLRTPLHPRDSFSGWIGSVLKHRGSEDRVASAEILAGLAECERNGLQCVGEILTDTDPAAYPQSDTLTKVLFQEAIGLTSERMEQQFRMVEQRVRQIRGMQRDDLHAAVSPHAPYTVHPQLLQQLADLCVREQLPVAMHLAETRAELQLLEQGTGELAEMLQRMGLFSGQTFPGGRELCSLLEVIAAAPRSLVIHGNYLSSRELDYLQQNPQMSVVYCPRTHAWFRHTEYPLQQMLSRGIRVVIGTDSRASTPDLNLLLELAEVLRRYAWLKIETAVGMVTNSAAAAIGPAMAVSQLLTGEVASGILLTAASDSDLRELFARREFEVLARLQAGVIRSEGMFGSGDEGPFRGSSCQSTEATEERK